MPLIGDAKKEYQRKWLAERRAKLIKMLGGACYNCASIKDLEFHHRNTEDKEININKILSHSWKRIMEEIKKCDILCHRCHVEKKPKDIVHGTYDGYQHHGCRCEDCKEAKRVSRYKYGEI